ncbi:MAG TPA: hypothetical protein P5171_00990 [Xanthomonadaceae bacterium]|nr:hypothetical protein [Xanthomonadaceae bacterium]
MQKRRNCALEHPLYRVEHVIAKQIVSSLGCLLLASSLWAAEQTGADQAAAGSPFSLRAAKLEPQPSIRGQGRYRITAVLDPAPTTVNSSGAGRLTLSASLKAAGIPQCPLPGTIFKDGLEALP